MTFLNSSPSHEMRVKKENHHVNSLKGSWEPPGILHCTLKTAEFPKNKNIPPDRKLLVDCVSRVGHFASLYLSFFIC